MNVDITLTNCAFKRNKATKHGGAVALQTHGSVVIRDCAFEDNKANNIGSSSSSLLLAEKNEGRGGAIFISAGDSNGHVASVTINKCTFKRNIAFDGFAIYIEGEDSEASFSITENDFTDNYNINSDLSNRASISSEIIGITKDELEGKNTFSNIYEGFDALKFIHVDHQGIPLPTPNPDYINRNYTGNFAKEQVDTNTDLVEEISGCRFINIVSPDKNYYIKVNSHVEIFDNVFENTELDDNRPAPFWISGGQGQITIKNCQFNRVVSLRSASAGNILNSDSTTKVIFEDCQFNNCGLQSSKALFVFQGNNQGSAVFTRCSFYFDVASDSCQVIDIKRSEVIFDDCIFTRCEAETIKFNIGGGSGNTGEFQFINNVVTEMNYKFIHAINVRDTITFVNNTFDQGTLENSYLIYIEHNQASINLINNSFSQFVVTGNDAINCGGIAIFFKAPESTRLHLTYENCNFTNIQNSHTSSQHSNGGAIQFGFASECANVDVSLTNCLFKGNKSPKHGGAVAIQTQGAVLIRNCIFEENKANNAIQRLLAEKTEGRGGALFISCGNSAKPIESVTIDQCTFDRNSAFDGLAIYIEGEATTTTSFTIKANKFNGNSSPEKTVSCIASEVLSIEKIKIENENEFTNNLNKKFTHVDQSGNPYPEQTAAPSPTLPSEPNIEIWDDHTEENKKRCEMRLNPEIEKERNIVVDVQTTSFENMEYNEGGAIHLVNCGLKCSNKCQFTHCVSREGPGGAIYIKNANELLNGVILHDLTFTSNSAQYGGAIYIYSSSSLNIIQITKSRFFSNEASLTPTADGIIGGSAMYLVINRGSISGCSFKQNKGPGSVTLINDFQSSSSLFLSNDYSVSIDDCSFENDKSSIFFQSGMLSPSVQVRRCVFSGKLEKGSHHIEGKLIVKNAPKLVVSDCTFSGSAKEALGLNEEFLSVDMKKQVFRKEKVDGKWKFVSNYTLPAVAVIAVAVIAFSMKKIKNNSPDQDENESENIAANDEIKQSLI